MNIRLEDIARMLAKDMMNKSVVGHTITVKVKLETFDVLSRSQSQKRGVYIQNPEELATIASGLFAAIRAHHKKENNNNSNNNKDHHHRDSSRFSVRLLGIRCSNLIEESSFHAKKQEGAIDKFLTSSSSSPQSDCGIGIGIAQCGTMNSARKQMITTIKGDKIDHHVTVNRPLLFNRYVTKQNTGAFSPTRSSSNNRKGRGIAATTATTTATNHRGSDSDSGGNASRGLFNVATKNDKTDTAPITGVAAVTVAAPIEDEDKHKPQPIQQHRVDVGDDDKEKEKERVYCPLCRRSFFAKDNDRLNAHIDTCLNGVYGGSTVRQVIREEESRHQDSLVVEAVKSRKVQLLTDFWC